jgi:hypothetical protein
MSKTALILSHANALQRLRAFFSILRISNDLTDQLVLVRVAAKESQYGNWRDVLSSTRRR